MAIKTNRVMKRGEKDRDREIEGEIEGGRAANLFGMCSH